MKLFVRNIHSQEEREDIIKFSKEYTKYLNGLSKQLFIDKSKIDFVIQMSNYRDYSFEDDDYILTEKLIIEEAKKNEHVSNAKGIIEYISKVYDIPKEFFLVNVPNHIENITYQILPSFWKCPVAMSVPNIKGNVNIVSYEMERHGYIKVAEKKRYCDEYEWIEIIFNPKYQESIRDMLNDVDATLYHYSPDFNDDYIEEYGIIPKDGTRIFKYKHRAFYYLKKEIDTTKFNNMMKSIIRQRKKMCPEWSGYLTEYIIFVRDLPVDIDFFWDPNAADCVYTNKTIKFDYITKIRHKQKF